MDHLVLAGHGTSLKIAVERGREMGYRVLPLTDRLWGEARIVARHLMAIAKEVREHDFPAAKPALLVATGETVVTVRGKGRGGRNQELALAALEAIDEGITLAACATDGVDGVSREPVAGALVGADLRGKALALGLSRQDFLERNDSHAFFTRAGGHMKTGPTGGNLGDLILIAVGRRVAAESRLGALSC